MSDEKNKKYEEALAELEQIVRKMEGNEYDIDELAVQLKRAQQLITFCKDKLTKTEKELLQLQGNAAEE
ncbi:MAG: exodeoxyribonuclease VII small subunit [Prevotella sp.]|jgi:exodeoxyribonuclease VII small subunit|nr:exodeoxyribonuclease VII small subunit [Prevotella sp.]